MKLFYYRTQRPSANFGDELNPWLWPRLLPMLDDDSDTVFIGIGTVLNDAMPDWITQAKQAIFFSTGTGYGRQFRLRKQDNWQIYCVRGPLSADRLRLPQSLAITDGAALINRFFTPLAAAERHHWGAYMPHFRHGNPALFKLACQQAGIHYIHPAAPVETVISDIARSRVLLSEAMHGAIVADALRVPWIPVRSSPKILPFKWQDWCASLHLPYRSRVIRGASVLSQRDYLYPIRPVCQRQASFWHLLDGLRMDDFAAWGRRETRQLEPVIDRLAAQLAVIAQTSPCLSQSDHLERQITRLEARLEGLKRDILSGVFA